MPGSRRPRQGSPLELHVGWQVIQVVLVADAGQQHRRTLVVVLQWRRAATGVWRCGPCISGADPLHPAPQGAFSAQPAIVKRWQHRRLAKPSICGKLSAFDGSQADTDVIPPHPSNTLGPATPWHPARPRTSYIGLRAAVGCARGGAVTGEARGPCTAAMPSLITGSQFEGLPAAGSRRPGPWFGCIGQGIGPVTYSVALTRRKQSGFRHSRARLEGVTRPTSAVRRDLGAAGSASWTALKNQPPPHLHTTQG